MTGIRRWLALALGLVIAAGLVTLFRSHRGAAESAEGRDAPIVSPSRVEQEGEESFVVLDSADLRRIGLETGVLQSTALTPQLTLAGEVVAEPERVAILRAPVDGRLVTVAGAHWPRLGERVAAGTEIARVSDARPLAFSISGVVTQVSAQPGEIVSAGQPLIEVIDNSRPVVRVAWNTEAGGTPRPTVTLAPDGSSRRVKGRLIGPAAEADPVTRRAAYLYRAVRGWPGANPGTPVSAVVPVGTSTAAAALVPDRAVVQWEGLAWIYLGRGHGRFQRVRLSTDRPVEGGWLADSTVEAGDTVVITGAEQLLSEEFRARVTVGDESGE